MLKSNGKDSNRHEVKNILVVAITRLGDLLQASPTIVGLKREHPGAKTTVLVDRQFAPICRGIPGIDEIYEIDLSIIFRNVKREKDGIVEAFRYMSSFIEELKAREFDYCLNISSSGYTALLLKMLNIPESRGWISDDEGFRLISNPWAMLFAAFVYHSNRDYNCVNIVDIFRCSAGVTQHPLHLVYEVPEECRDFPDKLLGADLANEDSPLICVQVGASQEKRQWAPERFAALLKGLVETVGARVVLTGTASERPITDAVLQSYNSPRIINAAGKTNLGQLAALLQRADTLVTGDTGPMHLSVAVGTPVVAIFLASALCYETGPYSSGNFVVQPQVTCNPCNPNYPCARPDCHEEVAPELILHLVRLRLQTPRGEEHSIQLPDDIALPQHVSVFYTDFDPDGFLEFRRMNQSWQRNGFAPSYYDAARYAYRELWKEEFGVVEPKPIPASPLNVIDSHGKTLDGVGELSRCTALGAGLITELIALIDDTRSPAARLGEINREIEKNNRDIEEVGLSYPSLGALVRLFIMERDNMRGNDPRILASEMRDLYERLGSRAIKLSKLIQSYGAKARANRAVSESHRSVDTPC